MTIPWPRRSGPRSGPRRFGLAAPLLLAGMLAAPPGAAAQAPNHAPHPEFGTWITGAWPATVSVTIRWRDDNHALNLATRSITVNGVAVTGSFAHNDGAAPPTSTGTITLSPGMNTVVAHVCDTSGRCGDSHAYYSHVPAPAASPYGASSVTLSAEQGADVRVVSPFDAVASYATPAYISGDAPRGLGLVYTGSQATGRASVQVDAVNSSQNAPTRISIQVRDSATGAWVTGESFYLARVGSQRLYAQWNAAGVPSGPRTYEVVVRTYWDVSRGAPTDLVLESPPRRARVLVLNESGSPYGTGWTVAGLHTLTPTPGGAMIAHGDGTAVFFALPCAGCAYQAPEGEFTTLVKNGDGTWTRTAPGGSKTVFHADGRLHYAEDRHGNRTTYGYSGALLASVTDPYGQQLSLAYTGGRLSAVSGPGGRTSYFHHTGTDLARIVDPDGANALQLGYDAQHRLTTRTARSGGTAGYAYDGAGLLAADTLPAVSIGGGAAQRPVVRFASNEAVLLGGTAGAPAARPASFRGRVTDARGSVTETHYNRFGQPLYVVEPHGHVTIVQRNPHGQVLRVTSPTGAVADYAWSGPDLVRSWQPQTGTYATIDYEPAYHQPTRTASATREALSWYGALGQLDSTRISGARTAYTYDARGRVLSAVDPQGHGAFFSYDGQGNLQRTEVGDVSSTYRRSTDLYLDALGRDTGTYVSGGGFTRRHYDVLNRMQRIVGPVHGDTMHFTYDARGLHQVRDPRGQVYVYHRNLLGWVESRVDPRGASTLYRYDAAGNVTSQVDRRGLTVAFAYDSLGRLAQRTADGAQTTWSYGPQGRWVEVSNPVGADRVEFDSAGLAVREVTTRGAQVFTRTFTHQADGLRTQLAATGTWAGTRTIGHHYDDLGQVDTLVDLAGGATLFGYDHDGIETSRTFPTYAYKTAWGMSLHLPYEEFYGPPALYDSLRAGYGHDAAGRVSARSTPWDDPWGIAAGELVRSYQYDDAGRLLRYDDRGYHTNAPECTGVEDITPGGEQCLPPGSVAYWTWQAYSYDRVGNRTEGGAVVQTGNRLAQMGAFTFEYDADGNLTRKVRTGYDQRLYWNSLGQLDSVVTNGVKVAYAYDGLGRRVRRTEGAATVQYLYDGDDLLMELDGAGSLLREYTYAPGVDDPVSVRVWAGGAGGAVYYYATEHPGHVVGLFDAANQVAARYHYDPWGNPQGASGTVQQPLRYMGRELDAATGLYYVRNRWYDPMVGRFVSEDPLGLQGGSNPYAYAENSPPNQRDPYGLDPTIEQCIKDQLKQGRSDHMAQAICNAVPFEIEGVSSLPGWRFSTPREQGWSNNFGIRFVPPSAGGTRVNYIFSGYDGPIRPLPIPKAPPPRRPASPRPDPRQPYITCVNDFTLGAMEAQGTPLDAGMIGGLRAGLEPKATPSRVGQGTLHGIMWGQLLQLKAINDVAHAECKHLLP